MLALFVVAVVVILVGVVTLVSRDIRWSREEKRKRESV